MWLTQGPSTIVRISADGTKQTQFNVSGIIGALAAGEGSLWAVDREDVALLRIDPATNSVAKTIDLESVAGKLKKDAFGGSAVDVGLGSVWAIVTGSRMLFRVDPSTGAVPKAFDLGAGCEPDDVAVAGESVWVAMNACAKRPEPTVYRVDPATGALGKPIEVSAYALDGTEDALLTSEQGTAGYGSGNVIDPTSGKPVKRVTGTPTDVVVTGHTVWWPIAQGLTGVGVARFSFTDPRGADPKAYPDLERQGLVSVPGVSAVAAGGGNVWAAVERQGVVPINVTTGKAGQLVSITNMDHLLSGEITFG